MLCAWTCTWIQATYASVSNHEAGRDVLACMRWHWWLTGACLPRCCFGRTINLSCFLATVIELLLKLTDAVQCCLGMVRSTQAISSSSYQGSTAAADSSLILPQTCSLHLFLAFCYYGKFCFFSFMWILDIYGHSKCSSLRFHIWSMMFAITPKPKCLMCNAS